MNAEYHLLKDLSPAQINRLRKLTLVGEQSFGFSRMDELLEYPEDCSDTKIVTIKSGNRIVAWGFWTHTFNASMYEIGIYVDRKHRRKGFGTQVYKAIKRRTRKPLSVDRWSTSAKAFYDRMGAHPSIGPWCQDYE